MGLAEREKRREVKSRPNRIILIILEIHIPEKRLVENTQNNVKNIIEKFNCIVKKDCLRSK